MLRSFALSVVRSFLSNSHFVGRAALGCSSNAAVEPGELWLSVCLDLVTAGELAVAWEGSLPQGALLEIHLCRVGSGSCVMRQIRNTHLSDVHPHALGSTEYVLLDT